MSCRRGLLLEIIIRQKEVIEDSAIQERNKMMGKKYYIILLALVLFSINSCNKRTVPAMVAGMDRKSYDAAAFDYLYVEAIKQKLMGNGGDALKYLEQCIKLNPESDASYYQMAQIVIAAGDLKNGKEFAKKAYSIDPENLWYLMMLAGTYYQGHDIDSAIIFYEKAVRYYPDKENLQLTLGNLYTENGSFAKANGIFDALDTKYGVNESSTVAAIRNLMAEERYDEALVKAKLLLEQAPDEILYNGLLAEIYTGKGESSKAMEVYSQLIERSPDNPQTQLSLCDFLVKEKRYEELFLLLNSVMINDKVAREDKISMMSQLIEIPELVSSYSNELTVTLMVLEADYENDGIIPLLRPELLTRLDKLDEAAVRLNEIINMMPDNYYAWEKLLFVYLQEEDYTNLMKKGGECASRFNRSFIAKLLYANGAMESGKYSVALEELKKAEILAGSNNELINQVLTMRADVYYRMKNFNEAFKIFDEAIKTNSEDIAVMNNYAYYLAEQDIRLKEAEEMAKKVIEKEPDNNTYLDTYGWVLYKRGKLKEAAKIMLNIINSGDEPDAEYYEHYGFILKKQKKCAGAIENWNIALNLDSTKIDLIREIENCRK